MEIDFQFSSAFNDSIPYPSYTWANLPTDPEDIKETVFVTGQASPTALAAGGTADQQEYPNGPGY